MTPTTKATPRWLRQHRRLLAAYARYPQRWVTGVSGTTFGAWQR